MIFCPAIWAVLTRFCTLCIANQKSAVTIHAKVHNAWIVTADFHWMDHSKSTCIRKWHHSAHKIGEEVRRAAIVDDLLERRLSARLRFFSGGNGARSRQFFFES